MKKTIAAFFLILISLPIILSGEKIFAVTVGIIGIFGLKEMIDLKKSHTTIPTFMSFIFYISFLFIVYISPFDISNIISIDYRLLCFLCLIYFLPVLHYHSKGVYKTSDAFYFLATTIFLGVSCHNIIMIRIRSLSLFFFFLSIPILTDSFAYIFGRLIGKNKIAPNISPKKTWEGSICGTICATICSSSIYFILRGSTHFLRILLIIILLSVISQLGDLFFSTMKRENEIKDFSNLIPEHGGILDRFDSIIMVSLAFILFISYF